MSIRFRSLPHPRRVLQYEAFTAGHPNVGRVPFSKWTFKVGDDNGGVYGTYAPTEELPSFPSSVQYQGVYSPTAPYQFYNEGNYYSPLSGSRTLALWAPRRGRRSHLLLTIPGATGINRFFWFMIKTSTPYSLSADGRLWVAMPYVHGPTDYAPYHFGGGTWKNRGAAKSPPWFPFSPYTESFLCFPMFIAGSATAAQTWVLHHWFAVGKCTAGFTPHFVSGTLGDWQAGRDYEIDQIHSFGYSNSATIEGQSGLEGVDAPIFGGIYSLPRNSDGTVFNWWRHSP